MKKRCNFFPAHGNKFASDSIFHSVVAAVTFYAVTNPKIVFFAFHFKHFRLTLPKTKYERVQ